MPTRAIAETQEITSALTPAGPDAAMIAELWWRMVAVFGFVFVVVMLLVIAGIFLKRNASSPSPPMGDSNFILIGGIFLPAVILVAFLVHTLIMTARVRPADASSAEGDALSIRVTGHMWWWDVEYPKEGIRTANEIYIPVNRTVKIELDSKDVIHSLWVPSLSGKTDLLPGIRNIHWLKATRPGKFRGQCAEYCGLQHSWMALYVVAISDEEYSAWVESKKPRVTTIPADPKLRLGYDTFFEVGCASCHAIRGTPAQARIGPDLTHMGSRLSIGAAKIPNNAGNLAGWISNPQAIKPGNKMPATYMEPRKLHALVDYLMSLK